MRLFFSFGYGFKELVLSISVGDEPRDDLVGYGYDYPPILRRLAIRLFFIEIIVGNLIIIKQ